MTPVVDQNSPAVFLSRWLDHVVEWVVLAGGTRAGVKDALIGNYLDDYIDGILRDYMRRRPVDVVVTTGLSAMRVLLYAPILPGACRLVDGRPVPGASDSQPALTNERRYLANMFYANVLMARTESFGNNRAVSLIQHLKDILNQPIFDDQPVRKRLYNYYDRERSIAAV